ncbi:hypothetical protein ACEPAI_146 [Sanghuangporus weigelae]
MGEQTVVDNSSLDVLTAALDRLQIGCRLDSQNLWLGKTPEQLCRVTPDSDIEEAATSLLDTIQQLKRVNQLLDALSNSSKAFISTLREKSTPIISQHGIMSLPDEVLTKIYEYIKDHYDPIPAKDENYANHKYSRSNKYNVCQRIRHLAVSSPTLWTTLHSRMHREEFSIYLKRSKNAHLSIIFRSPCPDRSFYKFLSGILPHNRRWKEVTIECASNIPFAWESLDAQLMQIPELRKLDFPALTTLIVHSEGSRSSDSHTLDLVEDFFSRWKVPNLRHLSLYSVIPSRIHQYGNVVTSLTFNFSDMDVVLQYFFSFLATLPNLREFTLEGVLPTSALQETFQHSASFPHLTSLALRKCDNETLRFVLQTFDMPKVSKLILDMDISNYTTTDLSFLPILYRYTSLISQIKILELSLDRSSSHVHPHGTLDHLLMNFKSLEHFSLSSVPTRPFLPTGKTLETLMFFTVRRWGLKTIRIRDCSDLSATLPRIMYYLARKRTNAPEGGSCSTSVKGGETEENRFERLEIVGRTSFVEEDFAFVPREKIVWVPDDSL